MSKIKNKVLAPESIRKTLLENFFIQAGLEVKTSYDKKDHDEYLFVIDDYNSELKDLPRLKLNPEKNYSSEIESKMSGVFDESYLEDMQVQRLLKRQLSHFNNFQLIEEFSKDSQYITSIKLHESLNIGYFIDSIVKNAYKSSFDFQLIRKFLNEVFDYTFSKNEQRGTNFLIDVHYAITSDVFVIEILFENETFDLVNEYNDDIDSFKSFFSKCNYFNINYFGTRSAVTFSALWFKEVSISNFKSYFMNSTDEKSNISEYNTPIRLGLDPEPNTYYEPKSLSLNELKEKRTAQLATRFTNHIKEIRKNEKMSIKLNDLTIADIGDYLKLFPAQNAVKEADEKVKEAILSLLLKSQRIENPTLISSKTSSETINSLVPNLCVIIQSKNISDIQDILSFNFSKDSHEYLAGWHLKKSTDNFSTPEKRWSEASEIIILKLKKEIESNQELKEQDIIEFFTSVLLANADGIKIVVHEFIDEAKAMKLKGISSPEVSNPSSKIETVTISELDAKLIELAKRSTTKK